MLKRTTVLSILLAVFSFILFVFKIGTSTIYHSDFARDLFEIVKISQGNLTLLGPKLSFGGLYTAPYYYYQFIPAFILSGMNILSIPIFNAILFSLAIGYFAKRTIDKYSVWPGVLATVLLSITTLTLFAVRNPNNGSAYLPYLLVLLTYLHYEDTNHWLKVLILGFLYGVIVNIGFATIVLLPSLLILTFSKLKNKKTGVLFLLSFAASFAPILLFEIKNNFVMFNNTFVQGSYKAWLNNQNVIRGEVGKKNPIFNLLFLSEEIKPFIGVNPLLAYFAFWAVYFLRKGKNFNWQMFGNSLLAFAVLAVVMRSQFAIHYIYPVAFFLLFNLVVLLLESHYTILLTALVVLNLINFPIHLYKDATITAAPFRKAVEYSIEKGLVKKDSRFNVVHIAHPNAILGYEYRYYFQKEGYPPLSGFEYNNSDTLLIFTEKKNFDPKKATSWEIEQFGKQYLQSTQKFSVGTIQIYKADKHQL